MTAPAVREHPDREKIKRNIARMEAQGASDAEIEEYIRSEGLKPVEATADGEPQSSVTAPADPFEEYRKKYGVRGAEDDFAEYRAKYQQPTQEPGTSGFSGSGAGGEIGPRVSKAKALIRGAGQGVTLGFGDELAGALHGIGAAVVPGGKGFKDAYVATRDRHRATDRAAREQHGGLYAAAELGGGILPGIVAGPARLLKGGMAFGAASALGNAEGSVKKQAKATAGGAVAGGIVGKGADWLGRGLGALADKINPMRVARRSVATVLPDDAAQTFATRQGLAPAANVPGDIADATALGNALGKSAKTAIQAQREAFGRVKEIASQRRVVGKEYDALDFLPNGQPRLLPVDKIITDLADRAGRPLSNPSQIPFSEVHRLRHEVAKQAARAKGMVKHDLSQLKDDVNFWLKGHVPEVEAVDAKYNPLSRHLSDALNSRKAVTLGARQAAKRELGAGTRQGNRLLGVPQILQRIVEPSPARKAEALRKVAFSTDDTFGNQVLNQLGRMVGRPSKTLQERQLNNILKARQRIEHGSTPFMQRGVGASAGAAVAPQLSADTASANMHAMQLRSQGATDAQVEAHLSQIYTPGVVRFIVARSPQRLAQ